ncbi:MAG: YrhK family protein [Actinomycetota bacterium]|nr:YrhK family protein [Actinomycetota bacterium]
MTSTRDLTARSGQRRWLGSALRDFPWVHLGLGLMGNTLFVIGSVMFFWPSVKTPAVWLFVIGSLGMLLGSVGELLVRIEKRRHGSD